MISSRTTSALLALALLSACSATREPVVALTSDQAFTPARLELTDRVHRIPFDLERGQTIPAVDVRINGQGPFTFVCDTGASVTVIDVELVRSLGLSLTPTEALHDPSGDPGVAAWDARLGTLVLGDLTYHDVAVVATDRAGFAASDKVRGALGLPLFATGLVTLDYPKRELRVENGSLSGDDPDVMAYEATDHLPEIALAVGDHRLLAHIDSGASSGFMLPKSKAQEIGVEGEPRVVAHAQTINGQFDIWGAKLRATIGLGGHEFENPEVSLQERFPMANVGYQVLKNFALTIDQANHRMRFALPSGEHHAHLVAHADRPRLGVMMAPEHDRLKIQDVVAGGAAERAGVKAGDAIVSIGGRPVSELDAGATSAALHAAGEIRLGIEREGARIEIVVPAQ